MINSYFLRKGFLFSCLIFSSILINAQTTVQIGLGTQTPLTNNSIYSPICRFSETSTNDCSRSNLLYTSNELANVGITSGSTINKIAFYKIGAGASTAGFTFQILMRNSATTAPLSTATTWANILGTHTPVYATINQNIPATAGWVEFTLSTPFVYTGQNLEIAMSHDMTSIAGNPSTGPFDWQYTNGFQDYIIGSVSTTLPATLSGTVANYKVRPNIQFTYTGGTPCVGMPTGGTATGDLTVCPGVAGNYSVIGSSSASGLSYQWQSSPNGFVWTDIAGATGPSYSQLIANSITLRRRIICNAGPDTAFSTPISVTVNPFLNCYCASNATATTNSSIKNVTISNINNTSPGACSQYTDYTAIQGILNVGLTYPINVLTEDCEGTTFGTQRVAIFIDWNQNGLFTDAGELVYDPGTLPGAANVQFTGNISVPLNALVGITKMRVINVQATGVINPCGTYTTGETEDYLVDVQPAPANEAGVLAITQPSVAACSLGQQLWVNVQNLGTNDLTTANFSLNVNGLNIPVNNPWTGIVPAQSTAEIQVPVNYVFADGDSITVSVSLPNGQVENPVFAFNNTAARRVYAALSGNKTVYGAGADFANLNAALQALYFRGVCDTVYFKIASGAYNTQHVLGEYVAAGPGKLAVIESASGNQADVEFNFAASAAADNYVFRFDGGDGYMIRNLTAKALGTSFARVIDIIGGSNGNIIEGNMLIGDTLGAYSTTDVTRVTVASTNTSIDKGTVVRNNHIIGGSRSIHLAGMTTDFESENLIEGNTIEKFAYSGIYLSDLSGLEVMNNEITARTNLATSDAFGIYLLGTVNGGTVSRNNIQSDRPGSGIYLSDVKGGTVPLLVSNNFIYQTEATTTELTKGIHLISVNSIGITIANNSISVQSNNPATGAIFVADGTQIKFYNNNVGAFGAAPAIRIMKSYSIAESDNNNIFGTSLSNILGSVYTTLAAHQAATNMDMNSVSVNPGFNGNDLHTCAVELNATGMPLPNVTEDFDGDARTTTPDIGADEFLGDAVGLLASTNFLKCPAEQVVIGNTAMNGVTYSWSPSGNTSEISATNAGTYIITATSSCGSFSDTATVVNKPLPDAGFTSASIGLTGVYTNTSTNGTTYLWDFGDGNTSTDMNPSHVYESEGTYSVTLTVTNDCGTDVFGPTPINVINASNEENSMLNISLYPNPTNGQFTISTDAFKNDETTIQIFDIKGQLIMNRNVQMGVNQVIIDISEFSSGIYSIKVSNDEFMKVMRIIKK